MGITFRRALAALALAPALALGACSDNSGTNPTTDPGQSYAVVVNSITRSLTLQPLGSAIQGRTIGLGSQGSPVSIAVRGKYAVVPMGTYPFAAVVDLSTGFVRNVALPEGSGATGAGFVSDSVALVANSNLNTVTPVNVLRGTAGAAIAVGRFPQAIVSAAGRAYVINAELVNYAPAGHGTVTVIDSTLKKVGTIQLSGDNSAAGAVIDNKLYVVNSGSYGASDGSLSVADVGTLTETRRVAGFGNFPGAVAAGPDHRLYVGVYGSGVIVWDPQLGAFVHDATEPVLPNGSSVVSALGFDDNGRFYAVDPGACKDPGHLYRVSSAGTLQADFPTGVCPFALAFAKVVYLTD